MGNDQSYIKKFHIEENAITSNDYYSIFSGEIRNNGSSTKISVFKESPSFREGYWNNKSPLEHCTKNLMIYRHPSILKFIASWNKSSINYLATEQCDLLLDYLASLNDVQICLGLRNILCALIFLVEKADTCHLNVSIESIYIHQKESWRLGGLEHLWPRTNINRELLDKSKIHRNKDAFDENEDSSSSLHGIEQYSFGALCKNIFKQREKETLTHDITTFLEYCTEQLQNSRFELRPNLSDILSHPYFNNDFVFIHSFLAEILLKSQSDKQNFFTSLVERLRKFDEIIVAKGLIDLILSRIVVLDDTARFCVIPYVLRPNEDPASTTSFSPIFSTETFTKYVIPKIKQMFLVRDVQVRAILLEYFPEYVNYFPNKEMMTDEILPQLLLGIKDTNEEIVTSTLRCLADLVPILGASVVIGQNRSRIFSDGRPSQIPYDASDDSISTWANARSITPVIAIAGCSSETRAASISPVSDKIVTTENLTTTDSSVFANQNFMLVRLSPDGGEDVDTSKECSDPIEDNWSDWENEEQDEQVQMLESDVSINIDIVSEPVTECERPELTSPRSSTKNQHIKDLKEINIKAPDLQFNSEIDEFFKDMEPIIEKTQVLMLSDSSGIAGGSTTNSESQKVNSRLVFKATDNDLETNETAWESDWS